MAAPKVTCSPLATSLQGLRDVIDRTMDVWGIAVHQTGQGIVSAALKNKADPLEYAVAYYQEPDSYFAHYVIGHNGAVVQVADEREKACHIGFQSEDRESYLNGTWSSKLPSDLVNRWKDQWQGFDRKYVSPAHLFPGASPNNAYVGIELLPITTGIQWPPAPWLPAARFTYHQHLALVELLLDIAQRWKLPLGWWRSGRLACHEDVNPLQRHTKKPPAGWDPGALRPEGQQWLDMPWVRKQISDRWDKPLVG